MASASLERYFAPASLDEALPLLRDGDATLLAGGTDLMPQAQAGRVRFGGALVNLRHIAELQGVERTGATIRIGALATVAALMKSDLLRHHASVLVEACDHFASGQLRNAATIGGNICNASPAGDLLVPLLVLDAAVELVSMPGGARRSRLVRLRDFFTGPGRTVREPAELLAAVAVPVPPPEFVARFRKFGTRPALDIAAVSIGIGAARRNGVLAGVRVAFGAVAPTPLRAPRTEAALEGHRLDAATIAAAADVARDEVRPISDVRASEWYRRELIHNLTMRVLDDVAAA
ncbi:MAG TPA: FAD binding domain-containing protein [Casimicrobiaceae bacterium]